MWSTLKRYSASTRAMRTTGLLVVEVQATRPRGCLYGNVLPIDCTDAIGEVPLFQEPLRYSSPVLLAWPWHVGPNHSGIDGVTGILDGVGDRAFSQAVVESKARNGISCC